MIIQSVNMRRYNMIFLSAWPGLAHELSKSRAWVFSKWDFCNLGFLAWGVRNLKCRAWLGLLRKELRILWEHTQILRCYILDKCPVTVDDIKSTWEILTGQRISQKLSSDSDSSKTTSSKFEFDGFDLVQVLQLMSGLEDQLGVLALKVNEFHRKVSAGHPQRKQHLLTLSRPSQAEALELTKRRQSYRDRKSVV